MTSERLTPLVMTKHYENKPGYPSLPSCSSYVLSAQRAPKEGIPTCGVDRVDSGDDAACLQDAHDDQGEVRDVGQHQRHGVPVSDAELATQVCSEVVGQLEGLLVRVAAAGHCAHLGVDGSVQFS